jgi:tetratricopeptide (TPR) repeat protein
MKRHWLIAALLFSLMVHSSQPLKAQSTALNGGVERIREGRFDDALTALEQAHKAAPRNAAIENLLGITETQLGHIELACDHYRNAIRLDPTQAAPHRNLGFDLLNQRDFLHAEPELREAARLDPEDSFAHFYLLLLALETSNDTEAIGQASLAGKLVDNDPQAAAGLVAAEVRLGRASEAAVKIEQLERAGQLSTAAEYSIAVALSRQGSYREAVHCFRRIVTLDPSWENRYNLALGLLYDSRPEEASTLLSSLHAERPSHADTLMFLGSAYEQQEKMPQALEAYRSALAEDPSNPDRALDYTRLLMDMDRYDEAIQAVQSGLHQTSSPAALELRLGAVEMLKGNYDSARDAFNSALSTDPQLDAAYVGLAQTYARQGDDASSIQVLQAARQKLPGHYPLEYYFGLLASRMGREKEALGALEAAARLEPNSADPSFELGKLYASQQDWQRARDSFERVIQLNPQFAPAHFQLSHAYARLGLNSRAEQEAAQTHILVEAQRNFALKKQRDQAAGFQAQLPAAVSSQP